MHNDGDPTPDIYFGDEIEDHGTKLCWRDRHG